MMSSGVHHFAWKHTYHEKIKVTGQGSSLVVQWLVLRAFSALGSIIGQGTKISTSGQKKKKRCRWSRALKEELTQSGEELVGVQDVLPKVGTPQRVLEGETSMALR